MAKKKTAKTNWGSKKVVEPSQKSPTFNGDSARYPEYPENSVGRVEPGIYRSPGSEENAPGSIAVD